MLHGSEEPAVESAGVLSTAVRERGGGRSQRVRRLPKRGREVGPVCESELEELLARVQLDVVVPQKDRRAAHRRRRTRLYRLRAHLSARVWLCLFFFSFRCVHPDLLYVTSWRGQTRSYHMREEWITCVHLGVQGCDITEGDIKEVNRYFILSDILTLVCWCCAG
jgi:hypothetical protein